MKLHIDIRRRLGRRNPMIYGHSIEHFHRQIYGGVFDPGNPLSDKEGFRTDVLKALRGIKIPALRWPGGAFSPARHWKNGVEPGRIPTFDKVWRVEEPNTFGTDEYIALCHKLGCAPYIHVTAENGSAGEMSDWIEYCNLKNEGPFAKQRVANGHEEPYGVRYWSIDHENSGCWESGANAAEERIRLITETARRMKRVDPSVELSTPVSEDLEWNIRLLKNRGDLLNWISIHRYWDVIQRSNDYTDYEACMAYTNTLDSQVSKIRGLLTAMGLETKLRVAFDEWNLRGWYHPEIHDEKTGLSPEEYLQFWIQDNENSRYTMADAVFAACFLNMCNRNRDLVGMANFAPAVNAHGCIFTHQKGIVLRPTYHVFNLYVNELGETVLDSYLEAQPRLCLRDKSGNTVETTSIDVLATLNVQEEVVIAAVNKDPRNVQKLEIEWSGFSMPWRYTIHSLTGQDTNSYNDIDHNGVIPAAPVTSSYSSITAIALPPHSVNTIRFVNQ